MRTHWLGLLLLGIAQHAMGAAGAAAVPDAHAARLSLREARIERAGEQAGRYTVRARFAPQESAGELREGEGFALIGRLAKAGAAACGTGTVFRNGFEGN